MTLTDKDIALFTDVLFSTFLTEDPSLDEASDKIEIYFNLERKISPGISPREILERYILHIKDMNTEETLETLEGKMKNPFFIRDCSTLFNLIFDTDISNILMHINDEDTYKRAIAIWRLKIGK